MAKIKRPWKQRLMTKLQHKRVIEGQELPSERSETPRWVNHLAIATGIVFVCLWLYVGATIRLFLGLMAQSLQDKTSLFVLLKETPLFSLANVYKTPIGLVLSLVGVLISVGIGALFHQKLAFRFKVLARGQKGDNKLMTQPELKANFKEIPHATLRFNGHGGFPISHFRYVYYIDSLNSNSLGVGTSRSGKTESVVFPMIDNLSRALTQSSMIVNDVKKELLRASYQPLTKRGYDVYALDLIDPMRSMSYQLLQTVIFYWQLREYDQAQLLINSLTYSLYCRPKDNGTTKHFNDTAQGVANAIIISLLERAQMKNLYEIVTMYNVAQFAIEMGLEKWRYKGDPTEYNALDLYFEKLPQGSIAKAQYASTSFAADREKGSIMSTLVRGLRIFQLSSIAKLTSSSSLDVKKIGFPKEIILTFPKQYAFEHIQLTFYRGDNVLGTRLVEPSIEGVAMYFFDYTLKDGDRIEVKAPTNDTCKGETAIVTIDKIYANDVNYHQNYQVDVTVTGDTGFVETAMMSYCRKPIAIFMCVADEDKSLHPIASIFISQTYQQLIKLCAYADGKLIRRLQLILDEYGNMAPIMDLDNYMTASLGRGIMWNLFVQSFKQIISNHGKELGTAIIDNCQNQMLIMTKDKDTIKDFLDGIGKQTVEDVSSNEKSLELTSSRGRKVTGEHLLTEERLRTLLEGETVVIASLNRKDNKGRKIRPYPIFNTKETSMPLRYQFELGKEFNPETPLTDIHVTCQHRYLKLTDYQVNYDEIKEEIGVPFFYQGATSVDSMPETVALNATEMRAEITEFVFSCDLTEKVENTIIDALESPKTLEALIKTHQLPDELWDMVEAYQEAKKRKEAA